MATTGVYGIPYLEYEDPPDIPAVTQGIAETVEDELVRIDAAVVALQGTPQTVQAEQTASFSGVSSTSFTTSGGTVCGLTFVAPATGRVMVHIAAEVDNSSTQVSLVSFRLASGGSIGGGTPAVDASDNTAVSNLGGNQIRAGAAYLVSGLVAGSTYNCQLMHRVSSGGGTGTFARRVLIVAPAT